MADDPELATRRLKLKLTLEDLREMKGFGTELVTVVIPPDRQVSDARQMLQMNMVRLLISSLNLLRKMSRQPLSLQYPHCQNTGMLVREVLLYLLVLSLLEITKPDT